MELGILFTALIWFCTFLQFAIIVRVLLVLIQASRGNIIVNFFFIVTEPILKPVRTLIDKSPLGGSGGPIDFSPIIVVLLLNLVVVPVLRGLA